MNKKKCHIHFKKNKNKKSLKQERSTVFQSHSDNYVSIFKSSITVCHLDISYDFWANVTLNYPSDTEFKDHISSKRCQVTIRFHFDERHNPTPVPPFRLTPRTNSLSFQHSSSWSEMNSTNHDPGMVSLFNCFL